MEISNIITNVLLRYPLFGNVIANLEVKYTTQNVPAPAFTDGRTIYYKDEFFEDFDDEEKEFIVSHEILHIVLSHFFRNVGKDQDLLNFVEDAIINQLLVRDGLKMPDGLVDVPDALEYSVDELYMKFLPTIKIIKEWMDANTYHMDLSQISLEELYNKDMQELMADNFKLGSEMLQNYKTELEMRAQQAKANSIGCGKQAIGIEFPAVAVGNAKPLLTWQNLLESNIKQPDETTSFYEVEMDGIIRKETKEESNQFESEIIVDSSYSMDMTKIKAVLRECKNILSTSKIKVGFCDTEFYGWNDIKTIDDIDKLHIIGRGGTSFYQMAHSFTNEADIKIVITDGIDAFPTDCPDVLWVVINFELPNHLNPNVPSRLCAFPKADLSKINFIFIDEEEIYVPDKGKNLVLKKTNSMN